MPDLSVSERLQPALLDRLTDNEPDKHLESREQRVGSIAKLKESVMRDVAWLLGTVRLSATEDLSNYPLTSESVLNYGVPGIAGASLRQIGVSQAEHQVREALTRFEPRLLPKTLQVRLLEQGEEETHNMATFEIEADLFAMPLPQHLYLKTELDLDFGTVKVSEITEPQRRSNRARRL
jgi:type VI secretion system protein ImpF